MAVLLSDNFDRADSATSLGSPGVGGPYTVRLGTWGISGGAAYTPTALTNAHVTFPAAIDLDIHATITAGIGYGNSGGIIFRWVDSNNYWTLRHSTNTWTAVRIKAGASLSVLDSTVNGNNGDRIGVIARGKVIQLLVNGKVRGECEDHWFAEATNIAGLTMNAVTGGRIDDLVVADAPPLPPWGDFVITGLDDRVGATHALTPSLYKGRDTRVQDEAEIP